MAGRNSDILKILKSKPTSEIGILRKLDGTFTQTPREAIDLLLATHFPDLMPIVGEEWGDKSWLRTTDEDDFYLSITDEKVKQAFAEFKPYKAACR